jgi:hypothetical protein
MGNNNSVRDWIKLEIEEVLKQDRETYQLEDFKTPKLNQVWDDWEQYLNTYIKGYLKKRGYILVQCSDYPKNNNGIKKIFVKS